MLEKTVIGNLLEDLELKSAKRKSVPTQIHLAEDPALKDQYKSKSFEKKVRAFLLNLFLSNKKIVLCLSNRILNALIADDPNWPDRQSDLNHKEKKMIWALLHKDFVEVIKEPCEEFKLPGIYKLKLDVLAGIICKGRELEKDQIIYEELRAAIDWMIQIDDQISSKLLSNFSEIIELSRDTLIVDDASKAKD